MKTLLQMLTSPAVAGDSEQSRSMLRSAAFLLVPGGSELPPRCKLCGPASALRWDAAPWPGREAVLLGLCPRCPCISGCGAGGGGDRVPVGGGPSVCGAEAHRHRAGSEDQQRVTSDTCGGQHSIWVGRRAVSLWPVSCSLSPGRTPPGHRDTPSRWAQVTWSLLVLTCIPS